MTQPTSPSPAPAPKGASLLRLAPLAAALLLAGCPATTPTKPGDNTAQAAGTASGSPTSVLGIPLPFTVPSPGTAAAPAPAPAPAPAASAAPTRATPPLMVPGRTASNMSAMFARGTVNGEELMAELRAVRETMRTRRAANTMATLIGTGNAIAAGGGGGMSLSILTDRFTSAAVDALGEQAKQYATGLSYQALDQHLQSVMDNPAALRSETVRLPNPQGLNETQMRRTLVMATLVVTARVTNKMLKAADDNFKSIESGYTDLLGRREKAATVLYEVIGRGESARAELSRSLKPGDIDYTQKSVASMSVREFSQDLGAQNLALAYLQRSDPKAFAEYKAESEKMLPAAQGYARTVSGGVAFAVMLAQFSQEVADAARGKSAAEILALVPLASDFVREAPGLITVAVKAVGSGVSMPFESSRSFRVGTTGTPLQAVSSSRDVFSELDKRGVSSMLQQGMFRRDTSGLLHRMYLCSPVEAGHLLDTGVQQDARDRFAASYLDSDRSRFSFAQLFEQPQRQMAARERTLGDELLRSDYRQRADSRRLAFSDVQKQLADDGGYRSWTDEQLLRLIYVNREGQARHAELQLGEVTVRPVANAQSVYEYEALVDACRRVIESDGAAPARAPAAPTRPAPSSTRKPAA